MAASPESATLAVTYTPVAARREPLARVQKQRDELRLIFLSDEPKDI